MERRQPERVSDYYNLGTTQARLEFIDVPIHEDARLFLDPVALSTLKTPIADEAYRTIRDWFHRVLAAVRAGDRESALALLAGLHEPKETRLGYSSTAQGHGIGDGMAEELFDLLDSDVVRTNPRVIENVEDLALVMEGVDADLVSDITTNVVRRQLVEFTQQVAAKYGMNPMPIVPQPLWDPATGSWTSADVRLPIPGGQPLLLIPRGAARWKPNIDPGEYYRYEVLPFLQRRELEDPKSPLIQRRKPKRRGELGEAYVTKDSLITAARRRLGGGAKAHSCEATMAHPEVIIEYRRRRHARPLPPEGAADAA